MALVVRNIYVSDNDICTLDSVLGIYVTILEGHSRSYKL